MTRSIGRYGWKPDHTDGRDLRFALHASKPVPTPPVVSLRAKMPPVFDQGDLGSCTANACAAAMAFEHGGGPYSRLFLYYNERDLEGTVHQDAGGELRDVVKAAATHGAPPEHEEAYNVAKFTHRPTPKDYADALAAKISQYTRLCAHMDFHQCLAQGFPFIGGFTVYESFESDAVASSGLVPMPAPGEAEAGGHAICVIGYDDPRGLYEVRNSWGEGWGDAGNFWIPQAYFDDPKLASDFWTIRK